MKKGSKVDRSNYRDCQELYRLIYLCNNYIAFIPLSLTFSDNVDLYAVDLHDLYDNLCDLFAVDLYDLYINMHDREKNIFINI